MEGVSTSTENTRGRGKAEDRTQAALPRLHSSRLLFIGWEP